jgi:hypothetical protein
MSFINWGDQSKEHQNRINQLEWEAVHEQAIRIARAKLQNGAAIGGNSSISQTKTLYIEEGYVDSDYVE